MNNGYYSFISDHVKVNDEFTDEPSHDNNN